MRRNTKKIINNDYFNSDKHDEHISFKIEPNYYNERDEEIAFYFSDLENKINNIINETEYKKFNILNNENKLIKKPNKIEINKIYKLICIRLPFYPKIDLFSAIQEYFNIDYVHFYDYLSNIFKEELINELKNKNIKNASFSNELF